MPETIRDVDVALQADPVHGEGPSWDDRTDTLVWVDILGNAVHRFDPSTGRDERIDVGEPVGAAVSRKESEGLAVIVERGFGLVEPAGGLRLIAPVEDDDPSTRFNDGKCDPAGRFWGGTMAYEVTPGAAALYRLDRDYRVTTVLTGLTVANGLAWTADARTMFFIDSPTQGVDAFDFDLDTGAVRRRRRLVEVDASAGVPDGMTIDVEDCVWVALFGGAAVHRYTPDGRLDRVVELPTDGVTSCAFGGPEHDRLYITSSSYALDEAARAAQPAAGAVFVCEPGVSGAPTHRFDG